MLKKIPPLIALSVSISFFNIARSHLRIPLQHWDHSTTKYIARENMNCLKERKSGQRYFWQIAAFPKMTTGSISYVFPKLLAQELLFHIKIARNSLWKHALLRGYNLSASKLQRAHWFVFARRKIFASHVHVYPHFCNFLLLSLIDTLPMFNFV